MKAYLRGTLEGMEERMQVEVHEKKGEIPFRRKPKVSWVKVICPGLVGP